MGFRIWKGLSRQWINTLFACILIFDVSTGVAGLLPLAGVGSMIRIVETCPFSPPLPPVNATPVCLPLGLITGVGPVDPAGTGNAVPFDETTKFGAGVGTAGAAGLERQMVPERQVTGLRLRRVN